MNKVLIFDDIIKKNKIIKSYEDEGYTHLRAFHGCRPLSVAEYYKKGIQPIEKSFAKKEAIIRLGYDDSTNPHEMERFNNVFEEEWASMHIGRNSVWLAFSIRELLEKVRGAGHYVTYGSEFICGLTSKLGRRNKLKKIGKPTVFYCDVSFKKITESYRNEINKKLRQMNSSGGFSISGEISLEEIVGCVHPKKVFDPLTWSNYECK